MILRAAFDLHEAAHTLNVSPATVRNWIRLRKVGKLTSRANKTLAADGKKWASGSYTTPVDAAENAVKAYVTRADMRIADPCCGDGVFLLAAARRLAQIGSKRPLEQLWGVDKNKNAVREARLRLLLSGEGRPSLFCGDALLDKRLPEGTFDLVITNPPWGAHLTDLESLRSVYPHIHSKESFSFFLEKGLRLLHRGGVLSFLLPEAALHVKAHSDIRRILLNSSSVLGVKKLGRIFPGVFTEVVRLDVQKKCPRPVVATPDFAIHAGAGRQERALLNKMHDVPRVLLKDNAEWALGIVTGDNACHLRTRKRQGWEAVVRGSDVLRFSLRPARHYLRFKPENFQQTAPIHLYRAPEKLIYRFISKELVFAYDNAQTLTLNSANSVIPKIAGYPIGTVMALFNSTPYQFLFQKKFSSIKVLRSHLESLPLPLWPASVLSRLNGLATSLAKGRSPRKRLEIYLAIDRAIGSAFAWTLAERRTLEKAIPLNKRFLLI